MQKWRPRNIKSFAQGHTDGKWQSQNVYPNRAPEPAPFSVSHYYSNDRKQIVEIVKGEARLDFSILCRIKWNILCTMEYTNILNMHVSLSKLPLPLCC